MSYLQRLRDVVARSAKVVAFCRAVRALGGSVPGDFENAVGWTVGQLESASLWGRIPALYLMAGPNSAFARVNLMAPGTWTLTEVASPNFTAGQGYAGNGSSSYVHMGVGFASVTGISVNDSGLFVWSLTNANATNMRDAGGASTGSETYLLGRSTGGVLQIRGNAATATNFTSPDSLGFYGFSRRGAATLDVHKNGQVVSSVTTASTSFATGNVAFGRGGSVYSTRRLALGAVTKGLTATEMQNLYTILQGYLTRVGAIAPAMTYFTGSFEGAPRAYASRASSGTTIRAPLTSDYLELLFSNGNSTSVGSQDAAGGFVVDVTCPPECLYQGLSFPPGVNGSGARGQGTGIVIAASLDDFQPINENVYVGTQLGQTHGTGALRALAEWQDAASEPTVFRFFRTHGAAGKNLVEVMQGTQPYSNFLTELAAANTLARTPYGFAGTKLRMVTLHNGQQDRTEGTPRATFAANLATLDGQYNASTSPITGQVEAVLLGIAQLDAPYQSAAVLGSDISLAPLDYVRANPNGRLLYPRYIFKHLDLVHFDVALGYTLEGEYLAKAWRIERAGTPWAALGVYSTITYDGATSGTIAFFKNAAKTIPWDGLVVDTTTLPALTNYGLKVHDDNGRTLTGVTITSINGTNDGLAWTVDGVLGTNRYLSNAFDGPGSDARNATALPGAGAWCNWRDSDTTYTSPTQGTYLYNWPVIFKDVIP